MAANTDRLDAVIIPGGGVTAEGGLPLWTQARLDKALESDPRYFICLSAGTFHKPLPRDDRGITLFESVLAASYLAEKGVAPTRLLTETCSYDTLGNAYFARTIHTDPLSLSRLKVITSEFHMPRTRAIFDFVFGLSDARQAQAVLQYHLSFEASANAGLDSKVLQARTAREQQSLNGFQQRSAGVSTLAELHRWLFSDHDAYRVTSDGDSGANAESLTPDALASY